MAKKISSQIVFGRNPVFELLESGKEIEKIFLKNDTRGEFEVNLRQLCKDRDIPLKKVPDIKLDKLAPGRNHQGIIAISSLIHYQSIDDVISLAYSNGEDPFLIILDGLQDVRNIGAIARSCEVLGAHAIIVSGKQAATINEDAIKTSAGAILRLPICRETSTLALIHSLQGLGIKVVGSSLRTETLLSDVKFDMPLAVIFGSEGTGLSREASEACDELIKIPQVGSLDSLNVSVATGIVLYECLRQKSL